MMMILMTSQVTLSQQQWQMPPAATRAPARPHTRRACHLSGLSCRANSSSSSCGGQAVQPVATPAAWDHQHREVLPKQREAGQAAVAAAEEAQQTQGCCRTLLLMGLLWCPRLQQGLRPLFLKRSCRGGMQVWCLGGRSGNLHWCLLSASVLCSVRGQVCCCLADTGNPAAA